MTAAVVPATLLTARLAIRDMPRDELARQVTGLHEQHEKTAALCQTLYATEHAQGVVELPADLVYTLEFFLDLESGDLGHPHRWCFRITRDSGTTDRLAWVGGRLPLFSEVARLHEARQWVTRTGGRVIRDLQFAAPYEVFHGELERELGGDWSCAALDPPKVEFQALASFAVAA